MYSSRPKTMEGNCQLNVQQSLPSALTPAVRWNPEKPQIHPRLAGAM
jgi:hypothetical protein